MSDKIKTVGIVGTGVIGASWTALFLGQGHRVIVADPAPEAEEHLKAHLQEWFPELKKLGMLGEEGLKNLQFVGPSIVEYGQELDFVQENGPEKLELKIKIVADIAKSTRSDVVIASSSSGLPASQFIRDSVHPERVLIGHPFNPPHLMPLVEVVPHPETSKDALNTAMRFYESCGKAPIHVKQEIPGFAANRLQAALCNEAYSLVTRGILTAEEVDTCITNSLGIRWATIGVFMANALGGGPGGFKHLMSHVGVAGQKWLEDMKAHEYHFTEENVDKLDESVQEMLKGQSMDKAAENRDDLTLGILQLRNKSSKEI